jgi:hypothetical protein
MTRPAMTARRLCVLLLFTVAFLPFGAPRWFNHDSAPAGPGTAAGFASLCRDHGGTLRTGSAAQSNTGARSFCSVRYGRQDYVMDAVTTLGFDEDTARFQRQGCDEARRQQRAAHAPARLRKAFVYHPTTGVCERRD